MIQKCFIYMEISIYFLVRLKKNLHLRGLNLSYREKILLLSKNN